MSHTPSPRAGQSQFKSFAEFYPYYLQEHQHPMCRLLHFFGSALVLLQLSYCLSSQWWLGLVWLPMIGYGFAWLGHFVFEKNRPATFRHPWYSLLGDWRLFFELAFGRQHFFP